LIGWQLKAAPVLQDRAFEQIRLPLFFQKGKLRYIETNIRLFLFLLNFKCDVIGAIDLDTILPCLLVSKIRGKKIVYDAHEYFTELEEVVRRPFIKKTWLAIEKYCVPQIKNGYTISSSYADLFYKNYKVNYELIRNIALLKPIPVIENKGRIILYQGAVNEGRGLFQLVDAMKKVDAKLIVCGDGDIFESLKSYIEQNNLQSKIELKGFIHPTDLQKITPTARIGITLFETNGLSNYYSLANRFFDYLHGGIPQLCNQYPEYIAISKTHEIANLIEDLNPETIANALTRMLDDKAYYDLLVKNCLAAREVYNWQNEEKKLVAFYRKIENENQ
jgi:glycosyltransferase involved in cell wall biosynthesis